MKVLKSINSVYTLRYRKKKSKFQYDQSRTKNIIEINHVKKQKQKNWTNVRLLWYIMRLWSCFNINITCWPKIIKVYNLSEKYKFLEKIQLK